MAIKVGGLEGCDWRVVNLGGSDWRRMVGGEEKNGVGGKILGCFLVDALRRGCIEEWIGIGLRVGSGVY